MIKVIGSELYQWDTGRSVKITEIEADEVHFANPGDSKAPIMEVVDGEAKIPDYLLQTGKQIVVYAVENGVTIEKKIFPVIDRERPEDYVYDEDQRNFIYELITNAQDATNAANQVAKDLFKAKENGEFKGDKGDPGAPEYYSTEREEIGVSHEDITAEYIWGLYDVLKAEYPDNVQKNKKYNDDGTFVNYEYVISTGDYSDDGGYELRDGDDGIKKPKYLVMSGIDGNERLNVFSTYRFVRDILRGHNVPQSFKEGVILHVLPVGSPWGFTEWNRYNENGVHVYYNFECEWRSRSGTDYYGVSWNAGSAPASEDETQAITKWLKDNADADLFISYHNTGGINEIAVILGDSSNYATDMAKKIAMRGVSKVIPFWRNVIGYPPKMYTSCPVWNEEKGEYEYGYGNLDTIFSYSANTRVSGTDVLYAQETLGIPSFMLETPVYYDNYADYEAADKKVYNKEAIASGAETLGNILIEHYEQSLLSEVSDKMDSKLDQILQGVSFRVKKGSFTPETNINAFTADAPLDIPSGAKMIEIVLQGEKPIPYANPYLTVHYLLASELLQKGGSAFGNKGAAVDYYVNASNGYKRDMYEFGNANGFTIAMASNASMSLVFAAGKTYNWTAYYWD